MSRCHGCGRPIQWVETMRGKRMPIDPEPRDDGNIILLTGYTSVGPTMARRAKVIRAGEHLGETHYATHLATCPVRNRKQAS